MKPIRFRRVVALLLTLLLITSSLPAAQAVYRTNGEKIIYGYSGEGRELCAYRYGTGKNVFVVGFALHGYEDHFKQDGKALVYTAEQLMASLSQSGLAQQRGWSVYILPCMNPDGLESGYTENGPGRCTTMRYDSSGNLVKGGVDLNRCFPANFHAEYGSRNYTGPNPMAAKEARALSDFLKSVKGSGVNYLVDTHGWFKQTIVFSEASPLYTAFHDQFPNNYKTVTKSAAGYLIHYAKTLGYDACLFEFPDDIYSMRDFYQSGYCQKYIRVIENLLKTQSPVCSGGHDYKVTRQEPGCTAPGTEQKICTRCGDSLSSVLPALGHTAKAGSVVTIRAATATRDGTGTCTCSRCGASGAGIILPRVFRDTKGSAYYSDAIDYCYSGSLIRGTSASAFSPDARLSRAMLVTVLYRVAGSPKTTAMHTFTDVPEGAYYRSAVAWAYDAGIVNGITDTAFSPDTPITRQETAAIVHRYASTVLDNSGGHSDLSRFSDRNQISDYATDAVAWCVDCGILQGVTGTTLSPRGTATRAQGTVMLYRLIQYLENAK